MYAITAMKTIVPLSVCKLRHVWLALLLVAAITKGAETNLVISSSFEFKATVVWSNSLSGHYYTLQRASTLEAGAWFNVPGFSNVTSTNGVMTVTIPVSGPTGFYRVLDNGICCTNSGGAGPFSAVALGTVCGDTVGNPITITGCGGGWYRVTIAECNGPGSVDLAAIFTLTHPTANLFIYDSALTPFEAAGQPPTICVARNDVFGQDRTFDIIIEVRPVGFYGCDNWTLDIRKTTGVPTCVHFP